MHSWIWAMGAVDEEAFPGLIYIILGSNNRAESDRWMGLMKKNSQEIPVLKSNWLNDNKYL